MTLILIALVIAASALYFLGTALAESRQQHRTIGHGQIKFKGKGPEAWYALFRREKGRRVEAYGMIRTLTAQQRRQRKVYRRDVSYAISLASSAYGVSAGDMWTVAACESHHNPNAQNRSSSASGLFQFLDSTWASQGMAGFSVFDPVANALATARIVARQGWRQWSCQP